MSDEMPLPIIWIHKRSELIYGQHPKIPESIEYDKYLSESRVEREYVPRELVEECLYFLDEARGNLLHQDGPNWCGVARSKLDMVINKLETSSQSGSR